MQVRPVAIPGMKYGNYLDRYHDIVFVPMAFESMGATGRTFTTFLRLVSEQVHEDNKRAQADFRAKWRRTIGMALHNTVAKQYLISLEAHTTEQEGLKLYGIGTRRKPNLKKGEEDYYRKISYVAKLNVANSE